MKRTEISAPWVTFFNEITQLFKNDPEVKVSYDNDSKEIKINVTNYEKTQALKKILPSTKKFGNVCVRIVISYVERKLITAKDIFDAAFKGNPAFKYTFVFDTDTNPITYVVFAKEVVQYWNDDMSDPHGITSTLYQNIAKNVFEYDGVIYSTDSDSKRIVQKKYFQNHATNEEVERWDWYNGPGSFHSGASIDKTLLEKENLNKEATPVKDEKTFKSIFSGK